MGSGVRRDHSRSCGPRVPHAIPWGMNLRALQEHPWRVMIAVNAAVALGVLLHKITLPPFVPYIHLLVDYHFGFTKRALIGGAVSLFFAKVPVWLVFALGGAVWLITLGLFVTLFRRTFGLDDRQLPLFVFMAGSPFFFKNFMHTLGHFDIYGCALAIVLLLIPARSILFVAAAAVASLLLILIHQIHFLMYVPTIAAIVVLRHYLVHGVRRQNAVAGIVACASVVLLFLIVQFYGSMAVPEARLMDYLRGRMSRSFANKTAELFIYLVSGPLHGNSRHLGAHAFQSAGRPGVRPADLAARAAVEIFCGTDPVAVGRLASPRRHRRDRSRKPGLPDYLRGGVRLFAVDFELGGLHVPDPARGEDVAGLGCRAGGG